MLVQAHARRSKKTLGGVTAMQMAINQSTIMQCQTDRFISACARAGFKGVELRVPNLKECLYHLSAESLRRQLREEGIQVIALNSIDDFAMVPTENLGLLRLECETVGELARMVGCSTVIAPVARWFGTEPDRELVLRESVERLRLVASVLGRYDVRVGFEPIGFPEFTVREIGFAQQILDEAQVGGVGLVPDIYNLMSADSPESLGTIRYPIYLIHLNDAEQLPTERLHVMYTRTFPGEGKAKAGEWVRQAIVAGFRGWFSLELFRRDLWEMQPEEAAQLCYGKLRSFAAEHGPV